MADVPIVLPSQLTYEDFPYDQLCVYAGIDTFVTYELFKELYPQISQGTPY